MYFATNYTEAMVLNTFRNITAIGIQQLFVGLFQTSPGEAGNEGIEISYNGYRRQPIVFTTPEISQSQDSVYIQNTDNIVFPRTAEAAATMGFAGIFDSEDGGNCLLYGALREPRVIEADTQPSLMAGEVRYDSFGSFTNAFKTQWLNILRGVNLQGFTPHAALFNNHPEAGGFELGGLGYARPAIVFGEPTSALQGHSLITNTHAVEFPFALATWGTLRHTCIATAATGGVIVTAIPNERGPREIMHTDRIVYEVGSRSVGLD